MRRRYGHDSAHMPRTTKQAAMERSADDRPPSPETRIDALTAVVERLADEMRVIRDIVAELHECFEWAVQNDRFRCEPTCASGSVCKPQHVTHVTSMAKDPCDPKWGAKLNAVPAAELDRQRAAAMASAQTVSPNPGRQPELF